jgi:hypothetical protein
MKLLFSVLYAYYHALDAEGADLETFKKINTFDSRKESVVYKTDKYIMEVMKMFTCLLPMDSFKMNQSLEAMAPLFLNVLSGSDQLRCGYDTQLHVFHQKTHQLIYSYPKQYDPTCRQLYFIADHDLNDGGIQNADVITNIVKYYNKHGTWCFYHQRRYSGQSNAHFCRKTYSCFACHRKYLSCNTYTNKITTQMFCDGNVTPSVQSICTDCNVTLLTKDCSLFHRKKGSCRKGFKCMKCQRYIHKGGGIFSTTEKIKKNHKCGIDICYYCKTEKTDKFHQCVFKKQSFVEDMSNIAFVNFELSGCTSHTCKKCYEDNNLCQFCLDNSLNLETPFCCTLLIESSLRGCFEEHVFLPEKANHESTKFATNNTKHYDYMPDDFKEMPLSQGGSPTWFQKKKKCSINENTFEGKSMTIVDQLLNFLLKNRITNLSIIVNGYESRQLEHVIFSVCRRGLSPRVVQIHQRVLMVEVPQMGVRFIDCANYMPLASFRQMSEETQMPLMFFPHRWIKDSFIPYEGKGPSMDDLFCFHDSDDNVEEKKKYLADWGLKSFVFLEELKKYCSQKAHVLATSCLAYLKESFECQKSLREHMGQLSDDKKPKFDYLSPFQWPLFTHSGYSFRLFLIYAKDIEKVHKVNQKINMQSSKGELMFASFMKWKHPEVDFIDAWSPYGQKHYKEAIPDLLGGGIAYFYNG